jgi:hypothetical protein
LHKSATKCNETIGKWCKNKHGASKIIDTFETYQRASSKLAEALVIAEEKRQLLQRMAAVQPGCLASGQLAPHLKPASSAKEVPPEAGRMAEALVSGADPTSR